MSQTLEGVMLTLILNRSTWFAIGNAGPKQGIILVPQALNPHTENNVQEKQILNLKYSIKACKFFKCWKSTVQVEHGHLNVVNVFSIKNLSFPKQLGGGEKGFCIGRHALLE